MERTTVRLPKDLLDRARKKARDEGRTLTSLIEQGLREAIAERPETLTRREVKLPVSGASGEGLAPGLNWETLSKDVQEMEDLEYVERMKRGFR
jgi:hypothetical protein